MDGCDCILHLAAMSDDPSAELQPKFTEECNFETTVALAAVAKERNIPFLFSPSCPVYGEADGQLEEGVRPLYLVDHQKIPGCAECAVNSSSARAGSPRSGSPACSSMGGGLSSFDGRAIWGEEIHRVA
jgi:hypothetical protein